MQALEHYFIQEVEASYKAMEKLQEEVAGLVTQRDRLLRENLVQGQIIAQNVDALTQQRRRDTALRAYTSWLEHRVTLPSGRRRIPASILRAMYTSNGMPVTVVDRTNNRRFQTEDHIFWQEVIDLTED